MTNDFERGFDCAAVAIDGGPSALEEVRKILHRIGSILACCGWCDTSKTEL